MLPAIGHSAPTWVWLNNNSCTDTALVSGLGVKGNQMLCLPYKVIKVQQGMLSNYTCLLQAQPNLQVHWHLNNPM
jgi:hypothetical protein